MPEELSEFVARFTAMRPVGVWAETDIWFPATPMDATNEWWLVEWNGRGYARHRSELQLRRRDC